MLHYPVSAFIELTSKCNLKCKHCYNNSGVSVKEINIELLKDLILEFDKNIVTSITISGGEPLLYPKLNDLLKFIDEETLIKVAVNTNGIMLNDDKYLDILLDNNVKDIQISLDGSEITHDYIRGEGTYKKTLAAIKKCISKGIRVRIGYTVNALNYGEIEEVIRTIKQIGAVSMAIYRYIPSSVREGHEELDFDKCTLFEAAQKVIYIQRKYSSAGFNIYFEKLSFFAFLIDKEYLKTTKCLAGQAQLNVDSCCNISMCAHIHNISGNAETESIEEIWRKQNQLLKKLNEIPAECMNCEFVGVCKGGCKGISYCIHKNYSSKDECCFKELV